MSQSFNDIGLDARLVRALIKCGYKQPTDVQTSMIPKVLEGFDVVARARTGTGKTLAYILPALHLLFQEGIDSSKKILILVPTGELCEQVKDEAQKLLQHCKDPPQAQVFDHSSWQGKGSLSQLLISTPKRISAALQSGALPQSLVSEQLAMLVVDEADLLLAYCYEDDLHYIALKVDKRSQCLLVSATSSEKLAKLEALLLHNPVLLDLTAQQASSKASDQGSIQHFCYQCTLEDKLCSVMLILKLGLVKQKVLLFVNTVESGYRLKLYLEKFSIRAALINAEQPLKSRHHIIKEFNAGLFDYLIATDTLHAAHDDIIAQQPSKKRKDPTERKGKKKKARLQEQLEEDEAAEFSVTRGVDFKGVRTVVNVDLPGSVQGYVHRAGRTGRAGASGQALTVITERDQEFLEELKLHLQEVHRDAGIDQEASHMQPFTKLSKATVQGLSYRSKDVLRQITRPAIREARTRELRLELLNSERLQNFFEDHPGDRAVLEHDKPLLKQQQQPQLKTLPSYLKLLGVIRGKSRAARKRLLSKVKKDPVKTTAFYKGKDQMTDLERRVMEATQKEEKKQKKGRVEVTPQYFKGNVRKGKRRKR